MTQDPIIFTENAATKVSQLIAEEGNEDLKLRVYVQGGDAQGSSTALRLTKRSTTMTPVSKKMA